MLNIHHFNEYVNPFLKNIFSFCVDMLTVKLYSIVTA